jgi:hypothetical protein
MAVGDEDTFDCPNCRVPMNAIELNGSVTFKCMKCGGEITQAESEAVETGALEEQMRRMHALGLLTAHTASAMANVNMVVQILAAPTIAAVLKDEERAELLNRSGRAMKSLGKQMKLLQGE